VVRDKAETTVSVTGATAATAASVAAAPSCTVLVAVAMGDSFDNKVSVFPALVSM